MRGERTTRLDWVEPMAATLTQDRFDDPDWIFERKLDGIRCMAYGSKDGVALYTRNRLLIDRPDIAEVLERQPSTDFVLDGELVAFVGDESGFLIRGDERARLE